MRLMDEKLQFGNLLRSVLFFFTLNTLLTIFDCDMNTFISILINTEIFFIKQCAAFYLIPVQNIGVWYSNTISKIQPFLSPFL